MSRYKILFIPIEESNRDLETRLLLAWHAVRDGWEVVLGQQWLMIAAAAHFPKGVFFFKGCNSRHRDWMAQLRATGHRVVAMEEEATPLADEGFLARMVAPGVPDLVDLYFAQTPAHAEAVRAAHTELNPIAHGVSRFDLLRPEFVAARTGRVREIREKHGAFVLVNTNFGYANSRWGTPEAFFEMILKGAGLVDTSNEDELRFWERRLAFEQATMARFRELIGSISKEFDVVVRPHQAENQESWADMNSERVTVVHSGTVVDWVLASEALVQNSCTTGIEAALLGHRVVNFAPADMGMLAAFSSNRVVLPTPSDAEVLRFLRDKKVQPRIDRAALAEFSDPSGEMCTALQWQTLRAHYRDLEDPLGRIDFGKKLVMQGQQAWMKEKFNTNAEEITGILARTNMVQGDIVSPDIHVIGDNLFVLTAQ